MNRQEKNQKSASRAKGKIVIPDLIKKIRHENQKENICNNSNALSGQSTNQNLISLPMQYEKKKSLSDFTKEDKKYKQVENFSKQKTYSESVTNQSTSRENDAVTTERQQQQNDSLAEQSSIQSIFVSDLRKRNQNFGKLQSLMSFEKMFINPDKWAQFMARAHEDQKFHKALNVFLYSYFIQHYN